MSGRPRHPFRRRRTQVEEKRGPDSDLGGKTIPAGDRPALPEALQQLLLGLFAKPAGEAAEQQSIAPLGDGSGIGGIYIHEWIYVGGTSMFQTATLPDWKSEVAYTEETPK